MGPRNDPRLAGTSPNFSEKDLPEIANKVFQDLKGNADDSGAIVSGAICIVRTRFYSGYLVTHVGFC